MSMICGIARPAHGAVDQAEIARMLDALDTWKADARAVWTGAGGGLGHLVLPTTRHADRDELSTTAGPVAITGDMRIDNRDELAGALGIARGDLAGITDQRLVLHAYGAWGDALPEKLIGDFAFAIWDGRARRLLCARDPIGIKPLYYAAANGTLAFATAIKGLLALPFVGRSLNEAWIDEFVSRIAGEHDQTLYTAVRRLLPAHALTFDAGGVRIRRYWAPDPHRELRLARDEDYLEAFREKLTAAVRRRVDTPATVGAELSGGLDSSGICAIAQSLLREQGRSLRAYSQVRPHGQPDAPGRSPDMRWSIEALCRHAGITDVTLLDGAGGVLDALDWALVHHDEPSRDMTSFHSDDLYDAASASGVGVLLSGFGGDQCVSAPGAARRNELLRGLQLRELWAELRAGAGPARAFARAARLLAGEAAYPLRFAAISAGLRPRQAPQAPATPAVASRVASRQRELSKRLLRQHHGSLRARAIRSLQHAGVAVRLEHANVATLERRIEYRYPLLDVDLIATALAMPSHMKWRHGVGRYLFRRALEPWVPDAVRLSTGRASANPGALTRRNRDTEALKGRLRALSADDPVFQFVDLESVLTPPEFPWRFHRERHSAMLMTLALQDKLRNQLE